MHFQVQGQAEEIKERNTSGLFMTKRLRNELAQKGPPKTENYLSAQARQWLKSRRTEGKGKINKRGSSTGFKSGYNN